MVKKAGNLRKHKKSSVIFFLLIIQNIEFLWIFIKKVFTTIKNDGLKAAFEKLKYDVYKTAISLKLIRDKRGYENWIKQFTVLSENDIVKMKTMSGKFKRKVLVSIVMPTYNTPGHYLEKAIESVIGQIYENWELCIADDSSSSIDTIEILKKYEQQDPRIKIVYRRENGHISLASNSAIELATGDFIALLDHDDILSPDALFWVVEAINKNSEAALIYSDEDKIDDSGKRSDPYFKCDWNYMLFLSQNLVSHLGVFKTKTVKEIGGFRKGFEGSQDYDLALRFTEYIDALQIVHIPRVLYHWRIHKESTSKSVAQKPYAVFAAQKALTQHLERKNVKAGVEILPFNMYRVKYVLPAVVPLISIIIPSKNNRKFLEKCIESVISNTNYSTYEMLVVDNGSTHRGTLRYLEKLKEKDNIRILKYDSQFNFSAIVNRAAKMAKGDFLLLLNDDTSVINPNWLDEMVSIALQPGVGIVGAKLWYSGNTLQHGGIILGIGGIGSHAHKHFSKINRGYFNRANLIQEFSAVTGACMLVDKNVFNNIGGFNEADLHVAFNDVDFCLRAKQLGYKTVWTPFAELYHYESKSRGNDLHPDKIERFEKEIKYMNEKWGNIIQNDPAYSPNLTLIAEDFSLSWPPRINYRL